MNTMNITDMLSIAECFQSGSSLVVKYEGGVLSCASSNASAEKANRAFIDWVGEARLRDICLIPELQLDYDHLYLNKKTIKRIFLGIMHTECLYPEAREELTTLFMGKAPQIEQFHRDLAIEAGKFRTGLRQRVFLLAHHHYQCQTETNEEMGRIREIELLTSRLADRELPKGTLIPLQNGKYRVEETFIGGGAFVLLLRDEKRQFPPKIVCRGTSARPFATEAFNSCLNDLQIQIGSRGVKTIWGELHKYLVREKITAVEVSGKSLGGAHAQQLAVLIEGIGGIEVLNLTTYCSVGVGSSINNVFKEKILKYREKPFNLNIIRNGGDAQSRNIDYVPIVGGEHLGAGNPENCKINLSYIHPGNVEVTAIPHRMSLFEKIIKFIRSFSFAHTRQSTLSDFSIKKIDQAHELHQHLILGNLLERARKIISYIFHYFTLTKFNGLSFRNYFDLKARMTPN